jgi:DNA-binding GntR family transcriptional regulator
VAAATALFYKGPERQGSGTRVMAGQRGLLDDQLLQAKPAVAAGEAMWEAAYRVLKHRIIHNELGPGAEIDDKALALELGISRTPVREAIVRLESEKLVVIQPRHAIRVQALSVSAMSQIYDLLTAVETYAVWILAARRPSTEDLRFLEEPVEEMRAALQEDDLAAWIAADERFHRALLTLSRNDYAAEVGFAFRDRVHRAHVIALKLRKKPVRSVERHNELVELIRAGDANAARDSHLAQRQAAGEELIALVTQAGLRQL